MRWALPCQSNYEIGPELKQIGLLEFSAETYLSCNKIADNNYRIKILVCYI